MFDLAIRGGTIVTSGTRFVTDLGIQDGKIAQIGGSISSARSIDASNLLVLPGGIDPHVHLSKTDLWDNAIDDFRSGTIAAAAGGITTVGNMTDPNRGEGLVAAVNRVESDARNNSVIDFTQHPVLFDPSEGSSSTFQQLVEKGITSIKIFTIDPFGPFDSRIDDYIHAMEAAGKSGILCMVHCEDSSLVRFAEEKLRIEKMTDKRFFAETRPDVSETIATARVISISKITGAPVYIVHVSSSNALAECAKAKRQGLHVYVETRPIYLYFTKAVYGQSDGAKFAAYPPLRAAEDSQALWEGMRDHLVDTYGSDHNPWYLAQKMDQKLTAHNLLAGVSGTETLLPTLFSEGVKKQRLSLERFVELTSSNPAKLLGMFPQKGTISVGSDADITIWNHKRLRKITADTLHSKADFDLFEGWEVQGWPEYTISRGDIIFARGELYTSLARGHQVRRSQFKPPDQL